MLYRIDLQKEPNDIVYLRNPKRFNRSLLSESVLSEILNLKNQKVEENNNVNEEDCSEVESIEESTSHLKSSTKEPESTENSDEEKSEEMKNFNSEEINDETSQNEVLQKDVGEISAKNFYPDGKEDSEKFDCQINKDEPLICDNNSSTKFNNIDNSYSTIIRNNYVTSSHDIIKISYDDGDIETKTSHRKWWHSLICIRV